MKTPPQKSKTESQPPAAQSHGLEHDLLEQQIHELLSERTRQRKRKRALPLWNCVTIGKELGYSRQTIGKRIQRMINKGYPIAEDTSLKGYYYTQSFTPMLAQVITERELTRLFFAVRAVEALQQSPVFAPVLTDLQKLVSVLIDRVGLDYKALASCVTFRNTSIDPYVDPALLETLISAIRERQEVHIVYSKLNQSDASVEESVSDACDPSRATDLCSPTSDAATIPHPSAPWLPLPVETRTVHPLHILCLDNVWYLYLWDPMREDIRRFVISRMHSISRTGETFKPRRFNVKHYIDNRLGVTSGHPVKVVVLFRGKASYLVAERPWHDTQQLAPGPDSEWNLELTLNVAHTSELERWLFGFDQDFKVLEPSTLRAAIARKSPGITANHTA